MPEKDSILPLTKPRWYKIFVEDIFANPKTNVPL